MAKKKENKPKVVKIPSKPKIVSDKPPKKPTTPGAYKDTYGNKEWESKAKFLEMKLSHPKSIFSITYEEQLGIVKKGQKTATIDVQALLKVPKIDARFPAYILGFIPGGDSYAITDKKVGEKSSHLKKYTLTKKTK